MLLCGQSAQAQKATEELRIGLSTLYDQTLHPIWGSTYRKSYLEPMYDFIIGVDKNGNFDPKQSIAYKWEVAPNLLSWTFYIRDGVRFHNGDPLTIEDVKYTIEQAGGEKNRSLSPAAFKANIDRVEAVPPNKVVVYLKKPWPILLYFLSTLTGPEGMVQPKRYIEEKGEKYFMAHPIGSGPYKFYEWKENVHVKFVAQDSHWRVGIPKHKYLTFKLLPEEGNREAALRSGEVDIIPVGLARLKGLKDGGFTVNKKKDGIFLSLLFLQDWRPEFPTHKQEVRQALIYAINKREILKEILMGEGELVGSAVCMLTWALEYKPYPLTPYDPELAKKLLSKAGYPNGFTLYMYSSITILPEEKIIDEAVASYWEAIGVKVKILEMDHSARLPVYQGRKDPPGPAVTTMPFPNRAVYPWREQYHSTGTYSHKRDPKLDRMIENFETEKTTEGYIASSRKIMDNVLENFYGTTLCTTHQFFVANRKVPLWEMGKGVASYRWEYIGLD